MQANRNSHTTSTKCQYQAANSKPRCWLRREVAVVGPQQADGEEDRADDDVRAVEARRHEEGGAVDVALEAEGGVAVLVGLDAGEEQRRGRSSATGPISGPCRSSCRSAWCAQVTVVPEVSRISVLRSGRCQGSKVSMPFGGQCPPVSSVRGELDRVVRVERGVEEGPEPGDEEHHLRGDEEDHAVAVADLHDAGVVALVARLADHAPPPVQHGVEDAEDAGAEDVRPDPAGRAASGSSSSGRGRPP